MSMDVFCLYIKMVLILRSIELDAKDAILYGL